MRLSEEAVAKLKVMAKNIGLIKISGKVGDLQFFKKDGKSYVGLTSSLSKDRILKDPAFKRTRENMAEFGGSASVSKSIRGHMVPLKKVTDKNLHLTMVKLIREIINEGSGPRGRRTVDFSTNFDKMDGVDLNKGSQVGEVLYANFSVTTNASRNSLTMTIDEFLPSDYMLIPEGATHYKIHIAGLALSNFAPVGPKVLYKPTNAVQHGIFSKTASTELSVEDLLTGGLVLTTSFPNAPVLAADVSLVSFVAVEFLQEVNGVFYTFASNNAVRIEKLF